MRIHSLAIAVILAAVGCGPSFTVIKQANPNPLVGQKSLAVEQATFEGLTIGKMSEADYVAKKTGDNPAEADKWKASHEGDKQGMVEMFNKRLDERKAKAGLELAMGQGGAPFSVKPNFFFVEPGVFSGFVNLPTEVRLDAQIVNDKGEVLDQIQFKSVVGADLYHPSVGQRMRDAAANLADQLIDYLKNRTVAAK
jgi:hypothetical protein